jgi:hypothetical protein
MITEIQLYVLILLAAVIWIIQLWIHGDSISHINFSQITSIIGVLIILLKIFDKWIWKWGIFYPWLVDKPYLQGTWKGSILSSWVDPEQNPKKKIDSYLVIKQTYSSIYINLITKESSSNLLSGKIIKNPNNTFQVIGVYLNSPKLLNRKKSPIHYGSIILNLDGNPPIKLHGEYWTDRNSQGEMEFSEKSKDLVYDYSSAQSIFKNQKLRKKIVNN